MERQIEKINKTKEDPFWKFCWKVTKEFIDSNFPARHFPIIIMNKFPQITIIYILAITSWGKFIKWSFQH